jgi:hypothetical protein
MESGEIRAAMTTFPPHRSFLAASFLATVAVLGAGCFDPTFRDPSCGPAGQCPTGWSCADGPGSACVPDVPDEPDAPPPDETADAGADAEAAPPDAPGGECTPYSINMIADGNFEGDNSIWSQVPADSETICHPTWMSTKEGYYITCMGRDNNVNEALAQNVTIPAGATQINFHGWRCLASSEPHDIVDDTQTLRLTAQGDEGQVLVDIGTWTNLDAGTTCNWTEFDQTVDVTPSATATPATFWIRVRLNGDHVTTFYHDLISLTAVGCQ